MDNFGTICGIAVTYHSAPYYRKNAEAILPQVDHLIIIDNGGDAETKALLESLKQTWPDKITLHFNDGNVGLAAAQNIGIHKALAKNYQWVLLLDDDSCADPMMIARMKECYAELPFREQIGILAPCLWDLQGLHEMRFVTAAGKYWFHKQAASKHAYLNVLVAIASGSLIKRQALLKTGLMRDDFFIDYIDTEYSLRLISQGWQIIAVGTARLYHRLGQKRTKWLLGLPVITTNHNASRRYTIYRNRVRVWKLYWHSVPNYIIYDMIAVFYDLLRIIFFETGAPAKLSNALRGFYEGWKQQQK